MSYNNKLQKKQVTNQSPEKFPFFLALPLIAVMAFIPLIVYMKDYSNKLEQYNWFTGTDETLDFFLYYKTWWTVAFCVLMLCCLVYLIFSAEEKIAFAKLLIPLGVYCGLCIISTISSVNTYYSLHGIYEQFEPVWMLLGYGVIVYYAFFIIRSQAAAERVMNWFLIGIILMCALGLSQTFGHDFFQTSLGKKLMTPSWYPSDQLSFSFEAGRPYMGLYNPNYIGFYVAMTVPVLLALIFAAKKLWYRIACGALIIALILILFASQSRAGILVLACMLVIMCILMRRKLKKIWPVIPVLVIIAAAGFFVINSRSDNVLMTRLKSMFSNTENNHRLHYMVTGDDDVTVGIDDAELHFSEIVNEDGTYAMKITDKDGNAVAQNAADPNTATVSLADERFASISVSYADSDDFRGFVLTLPTDEGEPGPDGTYVSHWYFTNLMKDGDSSYYYVGGSSGMFKLKKYSYDSNWLEKHYSFANQRGYIWARTLPLLKKYFFLGSGPDTFIIAFPNDDMVGMFNSAHYNQIVTKPHCMYLQIAVQTGIPSLIALLIFFGWYLIASLRLYWRNPLNDYMSYLGVGIFTAVLGYLVLALTNDSCVTVSPIFYSLIGIGLGVNWYVKEHITPIPKAVRKAAINASGGGQEVSSSAGDTVSGQTEDGKDEKPAMTDAQRARAAAAARAQEQAARGNAQTSKGNTSGQNKNSKKKKKK